MTTRLRNSLLASMALAICTGAPADLVADIEAAGSYLFVGAMSASDEFSQPGNPPGFTEIHINPGPDFNFAAANINIPATPNSPEARLGGWSEIGGFSPNQSARTVSRQTTKWVATGFSSTIPVDVTFNLFGDMGVFLTSNKNVDEVLSRVGLEMVVGTASGEQTVYFSEAFIDGTRTLKFNSGSTATWKTSFTQNLPDDSYTADYAESLPGLFNVNDGEIFSVTTTLYTDAFLTQAVEESVNSLFGDIGGAQDGRGLMYSLSVDPDGGQLDVFVPEPGTAGLLGVSTTAQGSQIRKNSGQMTEVAGFARIRVGTQPETTGVFCVDSLRACGQIRSKSREGFDRAEFTDVGPKSHDLATSCKKSIPAGYAGCRIWC